MNARVRGFFSGFPDRRFPEEIASRLREELPRRESLVFVSEWPSQYAKNAEDAAGTHRMFAQWDLSFGRFRVIDSRTSASDARRLVREATCVFLMGGHQTLQMRLLHEKGLVGPLRESRAVILGVSAGAANMGDPAVDIFESATPYEGLGLARLTIKAHYADLSDETRSALLALSMKTPVCAMKDGSAIFVREGGISCVGRLRWLDKGAETPFSPERLAPI